MITTPNVVKRVIKKLIMGEDYRSEVIALINTTFLDYAIDFFKRVAEAKMRNQNIDIDWYKHEMLSPSLAKEDIATHAGLNLKTIQNIHGNTRKHTVIEVSALHYDNLLSLLEELTQHQDEIDLTLSIKFRGVTIDLTISESLVVINALAVKRSALRGGLWSAVGKQVEKLLVKTLCRLHQVPTHHYDQSRAPDTEGREVDFFLFDTEGTPHRCEVKLMGRGNPESADAAFARDTQIFIADTLSESVKKNLNARNILWVELKSKANLDQFQRILTHLGIPFKKPEPLERALEEAIRRLEEEAEFAQIEQLIREEGAGYQVS